MLGRRSASGSTTLFRRLEEAQVSTIHGFLRRSTAGTSRWRRASIPCLPSLTEAQSRRLYDAAFQSWFQEQTCRSP